MAQVTMPLFRLRPVWSDDQIGGMSDARSLGCSSAQTICCCWRSHFPLIWTSAWSADQLQSEHGLDEVQFVGIGNYRDILTDSDFGGDADNGPTSFSVHFLLKLSWVLDWRC